MGIWSFRSLGFTIETQEFDRLGAFIPRGSRILSLVFDRSSLFIPSPVFLHFACYYQAEKGGRVDFSPALHPHMLIRYRPEVRPPGIEPGFEWRPETFERTQWNDHDFIIVRWSEGTLKPMGGLTSFLERNVGKSFRAPIRVGSWWLFEKSIPVK
jgi:hypothetical protein